MSAYLYTRQYSCNFVATKARITYNWKLFQLCVGCETVQTCAFLNRAPDKIRKKLSNRKLLCCLGKAKTFFSQCFSEHYRGDYNREKKKILWWCVNDKVSFSYLEKTKKQKRRRNNAKCFPIEYVGISMKDIVCVSHYYCIVCFE